MPTKSLRIAGAYVAPGEHVETHLKVSEFYTAQDVKVPVFIQRGVKDGPRLFVTAAVHGDEINGVQIVRDLVLELHELDFRGSVIGVPVVNRFGFMSHERYLPDRRDLNRSFPGKADGHAASRYAHELFQNVVSRCTHGIDLHTAGNSRTNMPQIRAQTDVDEIRAMAKAFGMNVILHNRGPRGTLRRACSDAGVPTIIYEAGETFRFQREAVVAGKRGVLNVMCHLGMLDQEPVVPDWQVIVKASSWVRADHGGLLDVYVSPGDLVYEGDEVAVITHPFGQEVDAIKSPTTGLVLGITTSPLVNPGNPICHVAKLDKTLSMVEKHLPRRTGPNFVPVSQPDSLGGPSE